MNGLNLPIKVRRREGAASETKECAMEDSVTAQPSELHRSWYHRKQAQPA